MPIIATFTAGATQVNVHGLHQWDYGQTLEIHDGTLPSGVCEVHFSCEGMTEAVVRSCSVVNGVLSAVIPDRCLEQTSPITAWVYEIGATSGRTRGVVVLPIIARTRPATAAEVPQEVGDKYTEAVASMNAAAEGVVAAMNAAAEGVIADMNAAVEAMNAAVARVENGEVYAAFAYDAGTANFAHQTNQARTAEILNGAFVEVDLDGGEVDLQLEEGGTYLIYVREWTMNEPNVLNFGVLTVLGASFASLSIGDTVYALSYLPSEGKAHTFRNGSISNIGSKLGYRRIL